MNLVKSMEEALNKMYSTKEEKNGEKIKLSKKKEKVDLNPKIEDEMSEAKTHNCATHVEHSEWGAGTCIPTQHTLVETERGKFEVTHYDVLFDDSVKEDVPVGDLKILKEKHHSHDPDDPHEHPHKNGEEDHDCDEVHPGKSHKEWEKENVEKEASTYRDRTKDDEKKKKRHFAFGGKKKSRHGEYGYGKGEEVEVENEEVELTELLKSKDKSVIDAFYNKDSLAGRVLSTSGKSLEKHGVGGQTIAAWLKGKIAITAVSDVKSTQAILRYMKNSIPKGNFDPKSWNKFFEEVEIEEVEVDGRTRGYRTALTRINTRRERVEARKGSVREVSPPDWEGTVKKMKKEKNIDNPWALAWYMKNKGYTPHATEQEWIQNSGSESFKVWEKHFIPEAYEDGTDEYKKHVKKMTPGQEEVEIDEATGNEIKKYMKSKWKISVNASKVGTGKFMRAMGDIPNEFRAYVIKKFIPTAKIMNKNDINYGNIRNTDVALHVKQWDELINEEVEFDEAKMGSSDTQDMYALMVKGLKAMPGSPKQKEIIKQINVIRKRMGMPLMKEENILDESLGLQMKMAFDDAKIKVKGAKGGKLVIDRNDQKKVTDVLSKSLKKGSNVKKVIDKMIKFEEVEDQVDPNPSTTVSKLFSHVRKLMSK